MSEHSHLELETDTEKPEVKNTTIVEQIYKSERMEFIGEEFIFNIIGSSHYILSTNDDFYEILACVDIESDTSETIEINQDIGTEKEFENERFKVSTIIESKDEFSKEEMDIIYKFGERSYTGIKINETNYETYHTYPEKNTIVYSRSEFQKK